MDMAVVELSRLQFALTAMYHFLFVPLTLGLSFILVIMESIYVMTGREIWRTITRFWGKLFGINFVLGVATGLTMEFEFGTNWRYLWSPARHRRIDGVLSGSDLCRADVLWLGQAFQSKAFDGHFPGGSWLKPLCTVDSDCERLDAESGRCEIQP